MGYQHQWQDGRPVEWPLGKVVCVGRNYAEHAAELNNPIPDQPLLFMKPATAAVPLTAPLHLPTGEGEVHYEAELAVLIGKPLRHASESAVREAIAGIGLALDLTLRDLQSELKAKGHPWERAKAFDGACPLSAFVPFKQGDDFGKLSFSLSIDGQIRQRGHTGNMITPVLTLIAYASETFTLQPGDVVLTGTPAGVGELHSGQRLELELEGRLHVETSVE
ncbi:fumarylacetoacetate hydrolase family protein [Marinobacter lacisalsi]|uniref:Fumarylacetoacetate hydrolase family protein n=1 Tax=Marinobacter lacisalsi TaxID=475979 RepID=A0ABV8QFI5_9GAMM